MGVDTMRHIKGVFLLPIVKNIRIDKNGTFDKFLTEEDKTLIHSTVLASSWYPWDTYKRSFNALAEVFAQGDMEVVRQWGHAEGEQLTQTAYKTVLSAKDPKNAFKKIEMFWKLQFDFGELDVNFVSGNSIKVTIKGFDEDFKVFFNLVRGWYEQVLKMCECTDIQSEFLAKSWEGGGDTIMQFSWTS